MYLLDNFSGHEIGYEPTHIKLVYFSPNLTSYVQPLDAGIIRCMKAHYRRNFCARAIDLDEAGEANIFAINQLEVMKMAQEAWNAVSAETIKNCWNHTGIQRAPLPKISLRMPPKAPVASTPSVATRVHAILREWAGSSSISLPAVHEKLRDLLGSQFIAEDWNKLFDTVMREDDDIPAALAALERVALPTLPAGSLVMEKGDGEVEVVVVDKSPASATAGAASVPTLARTHVSDEGQAVEADLLKKVFELRARNRIHGPALTIEEIVQPREEDEVGETEFTFEGGDKEIVERVLHEDAVRRGVAMDEDSEEEEVEVIQAAPVKKVTRAEMQEMCRILEAASLESDLPEAGDMRVTLRKFRGELVKRDMQTAKQTTMDAFFKPRATPAVS